MDQLITGFSKEDRIASILKSIAGAIPYAGNAITEIIESIIPNQRIDRIEKYLVEFSNELSKIDEDKLKDAITREECIDLIEESFSQATRALTEERRSYISKIVKNGIVDDDIEYSESKYILKLIQELNDQEIIWLRFFLVHTTGGDNEFRERHKNILDPVHAFIGSDERTVEKAALQENYKEHLERLGLIHTNIRIDSKTKMPEYDQINGKAKVSYRSITPLGRMVLKNIELYESHN